MALANPIEKSLPSEAFALAVVELERAHPQIVLDDRRREELVIAILNLAVAGQADPNVLARYAVGQIVAMR